jgi:glycosyltransferase involved in cell wall biosynthesis
MKYPKVSIILPNYNYACYLTERLNSIKNQTFTDYELIFLDDASTDNSIEIFNKFIQDNKQISYKILINQSNTGIPFIQWNKGVENASGDYIWITEADDFCENNILEKLVSVLNNNSNVGLAYCQSCHVNEKSEKIDDLLWSVKWLDDKRWENKFINNGKEEILQYLAFQNTIPNASAVLFKKNYYIQAGMAETKYKLVGDWLTWIKILLISDIGFIPDVLNYFRIHTKTVRSEYENKKIYNHLYEMYKVLTYIDKNLKFSEKLFDKVSKHFLNVIKYRIKQSGDISILISLLPVLIKFDPLFPKRALELYLSNKNLKKNS